jgi:hypothetical protein
MARFLNKHYFPLLQRWRCSCSQSYDREFKRQRCKNFTTTLVAKCVLKTKLLSFTMKNALPYYNAGVAVVNLKDVHRIGS